VSTTTRSPGRGKAIAAITSLCGIMPLSGCAEDPHPKAAGDRVQRLGADATRSACGDGAPAVTGPTRSSPVQAVATERENRAGTGAAAAGAPARTGRSRARYSVAAAVATLLMTACTGRGSAHDPERPTVYLLGGDQSIEVVLAPQHKGLGSAPPDRLGIAFTVEELIAFFRPEQPPVSPRLIELLRQEERAIRDSDECNAYTGDSPISMILLPSRDHDIRAALAHRNRIARFELQSNPRFIYGLTNLGRITYSNESAYVGGDNLAPSDLHNRPFGFDMSCMHLDSSLEGGCVVRRDLARTLSIEYSFCEDLLPHWQEIDNLYFAIAARAVRTPRLAAEYRTGDE
jgi:hypothetical protein